MTLPANPEYKTAGIKFIKFINAKINDGEIHHIPVKIYKNGLDDIPQLLDDIKHGIRTLVRNWLQF